MGINGVLEKAMMGTAVRKAPLEKALTADVSARHLSFLETGRSNPSAEMGMNRATLVQP